MMRYRVVLIDKGVPTPDRPIQAFYQTMGEVHNWVMSALVGGQLQGPAKIVTSDAAQVIVYETKEVFVTQFDKMSARLLKARLKKEGVYNDEGAGSETAS